MGGALLLAAVLAHPASSAAPPSIAAGSAGAAGDTGAPFSERAQSLGVSFVHRNGRSGQFYMPEINGAGCALLDYDNDGDLDLYLIQGGPLGQGPSDPADAASGGDRLFRNDLRHDLEPGPGRSATLGFTDVTREAGIEGSGYGFGAATGDFDNDGWIDLAVTSYGPIRLWRNQGDGTFRDVTPPELRGDGRWSVAAAFLDYDRDGWLDLYVGSYVDFSFATHKTCRTAAGARDYCGPSAYGGVQDRLLHNRGDGSFEDRSRASGIGVPRGKSLGVVTADFDLDGWLDLYVANDQEANLLWLNRRDGTFSDEALLAGAALDANGHAQASMGVDAADFDLDGDEDLFMTHLVTETDTLYRNDGGAMFADATASTGLGAPGVRYTSWGTRFFDYDNDGLLDLFVANGGVRVIEGLAAKGDPFPFHEPNQLFRGLGGGDFEDVSASGGPALALSEVSRGAAFGDLDEDGDTDVVVTNNDGPVRILINEVGQDRGWLGLRLVGAGAGRDMLGAWVTVWRDQGPPLHRRVRTDGSFASAHDPRLLFGLGDSARVERVRVAWPDGAVEEWIGVEAGRYTTLRQGTGRKIRPE